MNSEPNRRDVVIAGHTGDEAVATAGLAAADPAVRGAALGALVRLGVDVTDAIAAAGADPDVGVRQRVARLLPSATVDAAVRLDALEQLLADTDAGVVEVGCWAAGEVDPTRSSIVERLIEIATDHAEHLCRESAVAALGSLGAPEGKDAVLAACSDRATVRRRAVLALAAHEGDDVEAMLAHLTEDRDVQVRQAAEDLLAIGRGFVPGGA